MSVNTQFCHTKTSVDMEILDDIILKLRIHPNEIKSEDLQAVMLITKKNYTFTEQFEERCTELLDKLWYHLTYELPEFDDQLLCCTCFYSLLRNSKKQDFYLNKTLDIINNEIVLKEGKINGKSNTSVAVSLCYGMFQSSYLKQPREPLEQLEYVLKATFNLMTLMAYEYSQHTFICFKIMTAFKKVIETPYEEVLFNTDSKIKLLNLINHNWENPITGVRNLNRIIFQMLLPVLDYEMYVKVIDEVNGFYWNKAKFLMLTEIIEHTSSSVEELFLKHQWIDGLMQSLYNPGLVSAGADMYYAILNKLSSENGWLKLFLNDTIKILTGSSSKAIENFSNYWCLTTFKKFSALPLILISELWKVEETEIKLYSCLSILKQANKLGLIEKKWDMDLYTGEENMVLSGLEHCNTSLRSLAFEIISQSHKKGLPSDFEYHKVLKFLHDNVNSDCTVLRLSTLNNLANFFITLHTSFLNYRVTSKKEDLYHLIKFCEKLQMFVIESLSVNGNYQRKITTVKIAYIILKHFSEVPKKKQKQTRTVNISLIDYLKGHGNWLMNSRDFIMEIISLLRDPSTDVHDSVQQLLLNFYLPDISDTITMNHLIEESLKCFKSKFFFEISCGLNIFKLIINTLTQVKNVPAKFKTMDDIFNFTYNEIMTEYNANTNVVESIMKGKQMHSYLSLMCIIIDVIIKNSFQMALPVESMTALLNVLKDISNQFVWQEDTNTSSDFCKMNDMVVALIKSSNVDENTNDQTKISGLYQIVLNCLWLNVKASCDLAAILIQFNKENYSLCEESLNIIAHVLETSRHKGAIEAAGAALGQGIRYLTSPGVESDVSKLPLSLLRRKLNELLLETTRMSSVTRRGAGLSIMIHRIVSNDAKKGKPLFHYFMKTILNTCNSPQDSFKNHHESNDEKDLPKAIYIHFLTRIVTDSSLASDIMYYSADLAELAFGNLANSHWQIRNAALQLYGALIPKLIGQKKPSGNDDEIISSVSVACDELRTHSPKLWDSIRKQIKNDNYEDIVQGHSNLVPILNTLANIAQRYNFSYNLEQNETDLNLLPNIFALLGSPIYTVRRLTSKLIVNIYSFEIILNVITQAVITSENHLHGILMVLENCYKVYSDVDLYKKQLDHVRNAYGTTFMKRTTSCLSKWNLEKLFSEKIPEVTIDMIKMIIHEGITRRNEPGVFLYVNQRIQKYLINMPWSILPEVTSLLLNTYDFDIHCETILKRVESCKAVPENILQDVSKILLSSNRTKNSVLWKTLYYISKRIHFNMQISSCYLQHCSCDICYNTRYMLPFAIRLLAVQVDNVSLLLFSRKIFLLCNPESNDIDMRIIAAMANNELALSFTTCSDEIKVNAIKSAIILLQDEDEEIRDLSTMFYKILSGQNVVKHPFICLNEILNKEFLCMHLNKPLLSIQNICEDLLHFIDSISVSKSDELNPFANDTKNIYFEGNVLKKLLTNLNKTFE